jgi:hypothetical protein
MNYELFISNPGRISLEYSVPEHLQGIRDTSQLREADLELLDIELKANGSSLDEKISSGVIWRMGFPEMVLDVSRMDYDRDSAKLYVSPIHPHRADLAFRGDRSLPRNVVTLTTNALLKCAEGNYVLGIRGGDVGAGKIGIIPGGHTDYTMPPIINPLDTLRTEFEEELGYNFQDNGGVPVKGLFSNRDTQGINVLYTAKTDLEFSEVLEKWRGAKDRGEHSLLFQATEVEIRQLAETGQLNVKGERYLTNPFFQDCFRVVSSDYPNVS